MGGCSSALASSALRALLCLVLVLELILCQISAARAADTEPDELFDAAVRTVRKASQVRPGGEHLLLLQSLRQLRDPDLEPLFSTLSQSRRPAMQIGGILGLAELSPSGRVDTWKLSQIRETRYRALAIVEAYRQDLLGPEELRQILAWTDLQEELRVYVLLMLASRGEPVDAAALRGLMTEGVLPGTKVYAALTLRHLGEVEGTDAALAEIDRLPGSAREAAILDILDTLERFGLRGAAPWVASLVGPDSSTPAVQQAALDTLFTLDVKAALPLWNGRWSAAEGASQQVRLGLILLDHAASVGSDAFRPLQDASYDLVARMGDAGAAAAAPPPRQALVPAAVRLIAQRHLPSSAWVLRHAETEEPGVAEELLAALIVDAFEEGPAPDERLDLARQAAGLLLERNPARLRSLLDRARTESERLAVEAMLSGALGVMDERALSLIEGVEDWGSTRAASLAMIVKARYSPSLSPDDLYRVGLIFRGAGSVSSPAEVQAAWLYLKRTDQDGPAMAAVLGDLALDRP